MDVSASVPHAWTPEEKIRIAELLRQGDSGGQIAEKLDFKISRNAIIGLVHRDEELRAIGFANPPFRSTATKPKKDKPLLPGHNKENRFTAMVKGGVIKKPSLPLPRSKAAPIVSASIQPVGVPMLEIAACQCRYPLWKDNGAPDYFMCGATTALERFYCEGHRAKAAGREIDA